MKAAIIHGVIGAAIGILATGLMSLLMVGSQLHALDLKMDTQNLDLTNRLTRVETRLDVLTATPSLRRKTP